MVCSNCRAPGHHMAQCFYNLRPLPSTFKCRLCESASHWWVECTKFPQTPFAKGLAPGTSRFLPNYKGKRLNTQPPDREAPKAGSKTPAKKPLDKRIRAVVSKMKEPTLRARASEGKCQACGKHPATEVCPALKLAPEGK